MDAKRHIAAVSALVALACTVQAWTIHRAVVPAQDSIRYLTVAQTIGRDGLLATLRSQAEQPLFPALVWLAHHELQAAGWIAPADWASSLQLAAAVPLVLAVVPLYFLFCRLVGSRAALAGGVFYCLTGELARLGADGLSDSTHLFFCVLALWAMVEYFEGGRVPGAAGQPRRALWLGAAGVFMGIALLARAEALLLPVAAALMLVVSQTSRRWRQSWSSTVMALASLALGIGLVVAPYLAASGVRDMDSAVSRVLGRQGVVETVPLNSFSNHRPSAPAVERHWYLDGTVWLAFGRKDRETSSRLHGYAAATREFASELAHVFQYWLGVLALLGLWRVRRAPARPVDRFLQIICLLLMAAAWHLVLSVGYLSSRHLLLLLVVGLAWAGVGARSLGQGLGSWLAGCSRLGTIRRPGAQAWRWSATLAAAAACVPTLARPLHASRAGHRQAAAWLAEQADKGAAVLDSRGWTALYTGRKTYRYDAAQIAFGDPNLAYVVVEQAEMDLESDRGRTLRLLVAQAGDPVARFAAGSLRKEHQVVVHRWHPERFQQLGDRIHAR